MQKKNNFSEKSWIEISKSSLLNNLRVFKKVVGKSVKIAAVVKANAYGHGVREIVEILKKEKDVYAFAVDSYREAELVGRFGIKKPVIILGYIPPPQLKTVIDKGYSFVVYNFSALRKISSLHISKKAKVFIKLETGMNRQGVVGSDIMAFVDFIKSHPQKFLLRGVSTHFASADDLGANSFENQLSKFQDAKNLIKAEGVKTSGMLFHASATSGALRSVRAHFDLIRLGLGLYGLWPSEDLKKTFQKKYKLKPVLTWKSVVAQVKEIEKGETVGYSETWKAKEKTRVAVIPVGYSDGIDRKLSNNGAIQIKGKPAKIIGRISMNMFTADVGDISGVREGDEVIILGAKDGGLSADSLARNIGTINYEVVSRISSLLPRKIIK